MLKVCTTSFVFLQNVSDSTKSCVLKITNCVDIINISIENLLHRYRSLLNHNARTVAIIETVTTFCCNTKSQSTNIGNTYIDLHSISVYNGFSSWFILLNKTTLYSSIRLLQRLVRQAAAYTRPMYLKHVLK